MKPARTRVLSPEQAAYIAGLIDGEGTITLTSEHRGERRRLVVTATTQIIAEANTRQLLRARKH